MHEPSLTCTSAIQGTGKHLKGSMPGYDGYPMILLGDIFLRKYYSIFDNSDSKAARIVLAISRQNIRVSPKTESVDP